MEFHEKLQELRKNKGMTQEELAKELFVSRTAISKWESGKGYPSIDSLKEISKFFSVTIDELLSSEELISAAKEENCTNIGKMTDLLIGLTDIMSLMLILLPLYPNKSGETVTAVALYQYTQISFWISCICWGMFAALIIIGAVKVFMNFKSIEKGGSSVTGVSLVLSIIDILFLIAARIPYAAVMMFLLLIIKGILLFKAPKKDR